MARGGASGGGGGGGGGGGWRHHGGDVLASPPPSAPLDTSSPPSITQHPVLDAGSGPSTATSSARGRPDKRPMIFSRKRGRGH